MENINEEQFKHDIAQKIKKYRNTSQETLAENADISEDTISKIEREVSMMSSLTLVKICNALNVTPNDILVEFIDKNKIDNKLHSEILKLTENEKKVLLDIIELIKNNKRNN